MGLLWKRQKERAIPGVISKKLKFYSENSQAIFFEYKEDRTLHSKQKKFMKSKKEDHIIRWLRLCSQKKMAITDLYAQ